MTCLCVAHTEFLWLQLHEVQQFRGSLFVVVFQIFGYLRIEDVVSRRVLKEERKTRVKGGVIKAGDD